MKILSILIILFFTTKPFAVLKLNEIPTLPYHLAVSMGKVANARAIHGFFDCTTLTTTEKTVWDGPGVYVYPTAAVQMTVSSSSINDTAAGSGMRQVLIQGLDSNYNEISETITLNGQTPVTTVNSYLRIQGTGMRGSAAGASGTNEGIIYIGVGAVAVGVPTTIYNLISIGDSSSHSGFFTIPAGNTGYFLEIQASSVSNKPLKMKGWHKNGNPVFFTFSGFHVDGVVTEQPKFVTVLEEKSDIEFRATMDAGTGEVFAHAHLLLIN